MAQLHQSNVDPVGQNRMHCSQSFEWEGFGVMGLSKKAPLPGSGVYVHMLGWLAASLPVVAL